MLQLTQHELEKDLKHGVLFPPINTQRLVVQEGGRVAWRRLTGELCDTGDFRFVIDHDHNIFASDLLDETETDSPTFPLRPGFHHASLVGDTWPKYAGRAWAGRGLIIVLNNHTGHFAQPKSTFEEVFTVFENAGIDVQRAKAAWFEGLIHDRMDPDTVKVRVAPLRNHPLGPVFGVYPDDATLPRSNVSPAQYRALILGR